MLQGQLGEELKIVQSISPASRAAGTTNGTAGDSSGYDGVFAEFPVGAVGASTTFDAKLQESDDNSTFADITGAAIVQVTSATPNIPPSIDARLGGRANRKRYIRAVCIVGGSNSVIYSAQLHFYNPSVAPITNSPTTVLV